MFSLWLLLCSMRMRMFFLALSSTPHFFSRSEAGCVFFIYLQPLPPCLSQNANKSADQACEVLWSMCFGLDEALRSMYI